MYWFEVIKYLKKFEILFRKKHSNEQIIRVQSSEEDEQITILSILMTHKRNLENFHSIA
jgi:hypothetical protein